MRIAEECATIKPMHIIFGGAATQWYHGDLKGRALALIACLTGNIGQLGGGISLAEPEVVLWIREYLEEQEGTLKPSVS